MKRLGLLVLLAFGAACSAQAQIAFRASTSAAAAAGTVVTYVDSGAVASRDNCGSINPSIPAGNTGDVLIALVNARENGATVTMTGWNQAYSDIFPGSDFQVKIYWRVAAGGDPNTVNQSGICNSIGAQIARFRGVDTTQPLETDPIPGGNVVRQQANNVDTGSQTTTLPSSMLLVAAFIDDNRTVTQGGGWNEAFDSALNVSRDLGLSLHYRLEATAGTFSVTNWLLSGGNRDNYGIIFALRPAASSLAVNVPAGTTANDVMIASITMRPCSNTSGGACTTTTTAPAGWTLVNQVDQTTGAGTGGFGHRLFVYQRLASGTEPGSYSWSFGGTPVHAGAAGAILSFSGVDTANPIIASAGQATAAAATHAAPSVNTSPETNAMLVTTHSANSSGTWTPPGGMAERTDVASLVVPNDLGLSLEVNTESMPAAGATGTRTATQANPPTNDTGATHSLALRPGIAHYAISASSTTVANCDYAEISIVGHSSSDTPTPVPAGRTLTLSTSTGTGVWQAGLVAGTGTWVPSGANNGAATYTWPGGESGVTVRLRQSAVTSLSVNLSDGAATEGTGSEDPTISFVNSAFRISDGSDAALSIGTQIAGKPSNVGFGAQNLFLQAIRTDTTTGACVSLFPSGSDVSIDVAAQCNNPATCTQNLTLASNVASSSFIPNGAFAGSMNFRFTTANAEAPFTLTYPDAGQLTLQFRAALPSPPANQFVQGASNAFVTRPFGLRISGPTTAVTPAASSPVFTTAGTDFDVTITAVQWKTGDDANSDGVPDTEAQISGNAATPNFGQESTPATATLSRTLNAPAGGDAGTLGGGTTFANFSGGTKTQAVNWSEVGFIDLLASTNYLGAGTATNSAAGLAGVGRFRPKHFAVSAVTLTNRFALSCGAVPWSYMGEAFRLGFTLTAQNAQNATTLNYNGAYAKLGLTTFSNWSLGARSGATNLTSRVDAGIPPAGSWTNGVANVAITTAIQRNTPDNPDGPFTPVNFGIAPSDADTATMNTLDFDADNNSVNERKNLGVATEVRYGLLRMDSAVGSERLLLPIRMETQYWAGPGIAFRRNTDDGCTPVARQNFTLDPYTGGLNACETILNPASATFSAGAATLDLSAPGAGNAGTVTLRLNLGTASGNYCNTVGGAQAPATSAAMSYLRGRWTGGTWTDDPSARAAFGLYGGQPNNFIYFRENY